ncbi:IS630 family transposase [Planomonospora sp. ID67723]|uniref:IS630 family transposase n=1 Tax=Planomonospora sp. ID67723 TaxID=2738134 RepID=UPI0018C3C156|nr:IS630 family transposase [Planomonospora sp. ID67723]MBG0831739.1 IS630 family transposase [Planomonospora sp. ID67723]
MRYSDRSGGLSAAERERRQALRFQAADMFAGNIAPPRVARLLGITRKSAYEWHALWRRNGKAALASKGAAGAGGKLTQRQLERLQALLEQGAAAHGWADQCWSAARIALLIAERFRIHYTARGVAYLLKRLGWSFQVPAHRALRRDEARVATWVRRVWPAIKVPGRPGAPGSSSPRSPAKASRPSKGRTWARKGHTPTLPVSYRGSGRVSIAALLCVKPGRRTRLIYRTLTYHRRKHEPKGFGEQDFPNLLSAAHAQLGGPIPLVWDSLPEHVSTPMRTWITAHEDWLSVYRLPPYAPGLNPAEGIWAALRTKLFNFTVGDIDQLAALIRSRLKPMQYRSDLLNGFISATGLTLDSL